MIRRILTVLVIGGVACVAFPLFQQIEDRTAVGAVADTYLSEGPQTLGAANVVTAVVVTYRGLDTLGEVTVLFAASAGVSLALSRIAVDRSTKGRRRYAGASELVETGAALLLPLILLFGAYVFVNGHLSPGGGFQGGVVIAGGVLLALLAGTVRSVPHRALAILEMVAGAGYVAVGLLGAWLAMGFLDPRFLPTGEVGRMFSAGAIPVIYTLIGIKVGAELAGVVDAMQGGDVTGGVEATAGGESSVGAESAGDTPSATGGRR